VSDARSIGSRSSDRQTRAAEVDATSTQNQELDSETRDTEDTLVNTKKEDSIIAVPDDPESHSDEHTAALAADAIVAKLEDSLGVVEKRTKSLFSYGYIDSVEVDTSLPELHASFTLPLYWNRLALLVMGHAGYRNLPYSQGYGSEHVNPNLIRQQWKWVITKWMISPAFEHQTCRAGGRPGISRCVFRIQDACTN
jgi:hypothetical protein